MSSVGLDCSTVSYIVEVDGLKWGYSHMGCSFRRIRSFLWGRTKKAICVAKEVLVHFCGVIDSNNLTFVFMVSSYEVDSFKGIFENYRSLA
jgi:hypothetical protein